MSSKTRKNTIKYILPNLRQRWPKLKEADDNALAELYEDFSQSYEFGNNDEKFPDWVKMVFGWDL